MKFTALAIAPLLVSLMVPASMHAQPITDDPEYLHGHARVTFTNISLSAGQKAAIAVQGTGTTNLRLSVYGDNHRLIGTTVCHYDTCFLSWVAYANENFYATVENLGRHDTAYSLAVVSQ